MLTPVGPYRHVSRQVASVGADSMGGALNLWGHVRCCHALAEVTAQDVCALPPFASMVRVLGILRSCSSLVCTLGTGALVSVLFTLYMLPHKVLFPSLR